MKLKNRATTISSRNWTPSVMIVLGLLLMTAHFHAQETKMAPEGMMTSEGNFSSFSIQKKTATTAQWISLNENSNLQHPEFGLLPVGGPEADVVEILSKRTANERFFINPDRPSEFYQQTSYGPMHYNVNGQWLSLDPRLLPKQNGIYEASNQPEPVGFDLAKKNTYIKTVDGKVSFTNWSLCGVKNGQEQVLAQADWTNYTAGDDGIYITDVFPGIDLRMRVLQGAVKSDFVVKELHYENVDYLLFKDSFDASGRFISNESSITEYTNATGTSLLTISEAVIYPINAAKEEMMVTDYHISQNPIIISAKINLVLLYLLVGYLKR